MGGRRGDGLVEILLEVLAAAALLGTHQLLNSGVRLAELPNLLLDL
jgi:hypothetical protein